MTDVVIKTLEAKAPTANTDLTNIGAVQATVAGLLAKIPMGSWRMPDGTDAATQLLAAINALTTAVQASNGYLTAIKSTAETTSTAVANVLSAAQATHALITTANATSAQIQSNTAALQAAIAALQTAVNTGNSTLNTSLGVLHADGLDLKNLLNTANATLAAISASDANIDIDITTLITQATAANATLLSINNSIAALGTTIGAGKTLADVVAAINPSAKASDITALQTALTGIETQELTVLQAIQGSVAAAPSAFDMQSMYRLQAQMLDALRDLRIEQRATTLAILSDQAGSPNIQDLIDAAADSID